MLDNAVRLPQQQMSVAVEHDEDLLFRRMAMRSSVELARKHFRVAQPGSRRSGRTPEVADSSPHRGTVSLDRFDLVEVDNVRGAR
jgi:hypothetical protein